MASPEKFSDAPTVLVVEDEALIRLGIVDVFDDAGFIVLAAKDAAEAVVLLQAARARRIDVLFSDVNMPGVMDGLLLALHAREHWPWISLIVTSGWLRKGLGEMPANTRFFQKPYDLGHVVDHIRETAWAA
jgi:two-component system, response regulator PdtaR